jgi:antitoxin (DNA-binding transcriptional repressor) of toxin-antitoxin stability system
MIELDFREVIERFDEILDAVERGEAFRVFRNGRPIAILERSRAEDLALAETVGPA